MSDPKMYIAGTALQVITTGLLGLLAFMGRRILDDLCGRLKSLEAQHVHREEFERIRDQIEEAVSKEEWLRSHTSMVQRLDRISGKLDEMDGGQRVTVEIAAAIAAALNAKRECN